MKIVDYMIVHDWSALTVQYKVQEEIKNGWQPYGNFATKSEYFYQAMVRYETL